jgi:hypothetical protein
MKRNLFGSNSGFGKSVSQIQKQMTMMPKKHGIPGVRRPRSQQKINPDVTLSGLLKPRR